MLKLTPCHQCIDVLRDKLFEIKTKCDMLTYRQAKSMAYKLFDDMYTGTTPTEIAKDPANYNIEHVVLANIFAGTPIDQNKMNIISEPYSDVHIIFPTFKPINRIRANSVYDEVAKKRKDLLREDRKTLKEGVKIINQYEIVSPTRLSVRPPIKDVATTAAPTVITPIPTTAPSASTSTTTPVIPEAGLEQVEPEKLPEDESMDIYVADKEMRYRRDPIGRRYPVCDIGKCMFQPPAKYKGDIARIVFYFYLMYAYDPSKRPYTGQSPWIATITRVDKCASFNYKKWMIFFNKELAQYHMWAKGDPVDEIEEKKNKDIMKEIGLPNIFVGYNTLEGDDVVYKKSSIDMIDELLFGKPHDHNKYKNINFYIPLTCKEKPIKYPRLIQKALANESCLRNIDDGNVQGLTMMQAAGGNQTKDNNYRKYMKYKSKYINLKTDLGLL